MKYAEIYRGEIIQVHENLPDAWKNISNFDALSAEQIADLSWAGWIDYSFLPFEEQYVSELGEDVEYNKKIHRLIGPLIEKNVDKIIAKWEIIDVNPDEILKLVREKRNRCLQKTDWTQQPDVPMDEDTRNKWREYRQALRDITTLHDLDHLKTLIDDPFGVNWPKIPVD